MCASPFSSDALHCYGLECRNTSTFFDPTNKFFAVLAFISETQLSC